MNRRDALKAFEGLVLCPLCKPAFAAESWSYEGNNGPEKEPPAKVRTTI